MNGITNLDSLLSNITPELQSGEFVFCCIDGSSDLIGKLNPICTFRESEGLTVVLPLNEAQKHNLDASAVFKQITLMIHSSLEAVGLTAAFAKALTEEGISANVIAGYYHDHVFVQSKDAERAVSTLKKLAKSHRQ